MAISALQKSFEPRPSSILRPQYRKKKHGHGARLSISTTHMSSIPKIARVSTIILIFHILHVLITIVYTYTNNINSFLQLFFRFDMQHHTLNAYRLVHSCCTAPCCNVDSLMTELSMLSRQWHLLVYLSSPMLLD